MVELDDVLGENGGVRLGDLVEEVRGVDWLGIL